jgi:hypothetical protein
MCVCDIFYAFFYVTVYSKMSEFGDMLKDLSEEKLNLCKDIRRVVKTFLRHSFDIREKTWGGHKRHPRQESLILLAFLKAKSCLHSVSQYNRVLVLAWPLWRAGDKKLFFFFRRRRGQSKSAALNSRKRKIREIEELQAMLGRPWWVFFCAEQFLLEGPSGFFIFESDFSYFFCLVSMPQRPLFPMLRFFWPKLHSRKIYWRAIKNRELLNNTTSTH